MNHNIKPFKAFIKRSHYTHKVEDDKVFDEVYVFSIHSLEGYILMFNVMTSYGMLRSRVPLSALYWKEPTKDFLPHERQLWNCFSTENVEYVVYDFLVDMKCKVTMRDKTEVWAEYLFTVDWYNNGYSNEPSDYKCLHVLKEDNGGFLGQPNNRIVWADSNFITREFPMDKKDIKVDKMLINVENVSRKWVSEDTDSYFYEIKEKQ